MGRTRRKKKHTQDPLHVEGESEKVPRSFVIGRGRLPPLLRQLQHDLRKLMQPHTAIHLKEKKRNSVKDFIHVAGLLGVSHFLILSHTEKSSYLRLARCPRGPTLTFKIHSYSLDSDIARAQIRPRDPVGLYKNSPLIVLAGFGGEEEHLKLTTTMFQNIFPAINVNTVKLATCQRVVLLSYNKETKLIEFRHYSINLQPSGVSRPLRKLVQNRKIPDLRSFNDVSDFVTKAGYGSESEAEDEASTVRLASDVGRINRHSQKCAVKLQEIGPRMTLQLVKVEEGLCSGAIIFHEYIKKSPEEIAELRESKEHKEELRKQRRAEQEANVKRKELLKQAQKKKQRRIYENHASNTAAEDPEDEKDDAYWYKQETGQEPDAEFLSSNRTQKPSSSKRIGLKAVEMKAKRKRSSSNDNRGFEAKGKKASGKNYTGNGMADKIVSQRKRKEDISRRSSLTRNKKRRTG